MYKFIYLEYINRILKNIIIFTSKYFNITSFEVGRYYITKTKYYQNSFYQNSSVSEFLRKKYERIFKSI